ncbi:MAG: tRNA lysidine(34) synthetase TilS [Robiginitomaculum sp.]|nr:MAG: tRNA lysidine(34) synthetase TilS [Robiginitomaculum sp.]
MLVQEISDHLTRVAGKNGPPLSVAFSGGGDSTALLFIVCEWAKRQARPVFALIVDHGLREGSGKEAELAAKRAQAMGAQAKILRWEGVKPDTGIQEKARQARYKLLGETCRQLGSVQLLLGHTRDDQAETLFMRAQKHSGWRGFAGMGIRRLAPIWPELYAVEIMRPLLDVSRDELRRFNAENHLEFIDDPSNENHKFARIRARTALAKMPEVKDQFLCTAMHAQKCLREEKNKIKTVLAAHVKIHKWGGASLETQGLKVNSELAPQILKYLIHAVSGEAQAIPLDKLNGLNAKLLKPGFRGATLGGAQFVGGKHDVLIVRDPGAVLGRKQKPSKLPIALSTQTPTLWDGRFLVETDQAGLNMAPLMTYADQLDKQQKQALKNIPEPARAGLPCILRDNMSGGSTSEECELLWAYPQQTGATFRLTCLIGAHLQAMLN